MKRWKIEKDYSSILNLKFYYTDAYGYVIKMFTEGKQEVDLSLDWVQHLFNSLEDNEVNYE